MAVLSPKQTQMRLRVRFSYLVLFILFIGFLGMSFFIYEGLYRQHRVEGIAHISRILPLPIARLDGKMIFYGEVMVYQDLLPGFDEALEHVLTQTYIELLAEELGVEVSRGEIDAYLDREGQQEQIAILGWTRRQYEQRIVRPLLLAQKVEQFVYSSQKYQESSREAIDRIVRDLALGIPFTDLAVIYSEDYSASKGGYLDYYTQDEALMEILGVFDDELLEPSDVIELETAYAIAQLYDIVVVEEERARVGVQWIVIQKQGLSSAVSLKREEFPVHYFITWD